MDKFRLFFNHPAFIEATVERVRDALHAIPADMHGNVQIVSVADSIPVSMANSCDYVSRLELVRRPVSGALGHNNDRARLPEP